MQQNGATRNAPPSCPVCGARTCLRVDLTEQQLATIRYYAGELSIPLVCDGCFREAASGSLEDPCWVGDS
jgi:hypothetical protein